MRNLCVLNRKKREISIRRWLRVYWICVVVICGVMFGILQSVFLRNLTQEVEENLNRSSQIAQNHVENSLDMADSFIYDTYCSSNYMLTANPFYIVKYNENQDDVYRAKATILQLMQSLVSWSDMVEGVIVYTQDEIDSVILDTGTDSNYLVRNEIKKYIQTMERNTNTIDLEPYMIYSVNGKNYMLRSMKLDGFSFIIIVSEKKVLQTLQTAAYDEQSIAFVSGDDGKPVFSSAGIDCLLLNENEGKYVTVNGQEYLQTGYISNTTHYYFGLLTEKKSISRNLEKFQHAFLILFLVAIIFAPVSVLVIHKVIEQPLERIAKAMHQVEDGSLEAMIQERSSISEFSQTIASFNHMVARIEDLKIQNYEVQLSEQKVTMQYLIGQIRPHFYANILNMIYSLAEARNYEKIQKISVDVSNFSRYMFRDAMELVKLEREMEYVHAYMEIQKIRYGEQIMFYEKLEEKTRDALIPPFIIQGFVENSVKYAFSTQKKLDIFVETNVDEENQQLLIQIRDNGSGYPEKLLASWRTRQEEGHIGLNNIWRRIQLIYEDSAEVTLYNDHGAVNIITIPYIGIG